MSCFMILTVLLFQIINLEMIQIPDCQLSNILDVTNKHWKADPEDVKQDSWIVIMCNGLKYRHGN